MVNRELLTSDLVNFKPLIRELKESKKKIKSIRKKLVKKLNSHSFLFDMLEKNDKELELALVIFFKRIGYLNVKHVGLDNKKEDVQLIQGLRATLFDAHGTRNASSNDGKVTGLHKFTTRFQEDFPNFEVHSILILNHHKDQPDLRKRNPKPFVNHEKDAKRMKCGLVTTMELIKGYKKVKNGLITFEQFDQALHVKGLIKF